MDGIHIDNAKTKGRPLLTRTFDLVACVKRGENGGMGDEGSISTMVQGMVP